MGRFDRPKWKEALWLVKDMYVHLGRMAYKEPRRFLMLNLKSMAQPQIFFTSLAVDVVFLAGLCGLYSLSPSSAGEFLEELATPNAGAIFPALIFIQILLAIGILFNRSVITPFMYSVLFDRSNWRSKQTLGSVFFLIGLIFFGVSPTSTYFPELALTGFFMWMITSLFATSFYHGNNHGGGRRKSEFPSGGVPEITVH